MPVSWTVTEGGSSNPQPARTWTQGTKQLRNSGSRILLWRVPPTILPLAKYTLLFVSDALKTFLTQSNKQVLMNNALILWDLTVHTQWFWYWTDTSQPGRKNNRKRPGPPFFPPTHKITFSLINRTFSFCPSYLCCNNSRFSFSFRTFANWAVLEGLCRYFLFPVHSYVQCPNSKHFWHLTCCLFASL